MGFLLDDGVTKTPGGRRSQRYASGHRPDGDRAMHGSEDLG
jgi:hypothetical protein